MVVEVSREKVDGRVEEVVVRTRGAWHESVHPRLGRRAAHSLEVPEAGAGAGEGGYREGVARRGPALVEPAHGTPTGKTALASREG